MPGPARHDGIRCPGGGGVGAAPMTSDLDIYRTASVLIREHGEEANQETGYLVALFCMGPTD